MIDWLVRTFTRIWRAVSGVIFSPRPPAGGTPRQPPAGWTTAPVPPRDTTQMPGADPYHDWAVSTGFAYYGSGSWLPLLLELRPSAGTIQSFGQFLAASPRYANLVIVPDIFTQPSTRLLGKKLTFLVVLADRSFVPAIDTDTSLHKWIARYEIGQAVTVDSHVSSITGFLNQPANYVGTPKAVIGVIDDGIAFAHERFLDAGGQPRIEYLWDQVLPFFSGMEYSKVAIQGFLTGSLFGGQVVDEDDLYRKSGHINQTRGGHKPLAARASHGAHVMDLACHRKLRPQTGEQPIVAVQLPVSSVRDTSGATLRPQIYFALRYIVAKADAIAAAAVCPPPPVVVNVSYGTIAGPHDGLSLFERALDELIQSATATVEVVLPAGNNHLSRCHAELALAPGSVQTLNWRVLPDDWTESYLDIWMPGGGAAGPPVQVAVTAPDGARSGWIQAGAQLQLKIAGNTVVAQVSFYPPLYVGPQAVVRISMAPTASPRAGVPLAMPGLWRISVRNTGHLPVSPIHTWIERDDAAPGYKRAGAQSYLDDPAYGRYDDGGRPIVNDNDPRTINSHVKRRHTLNAIASGGSPIVIGGFRHGGKPEHEAWSGSSRGPALPPGRANGVPGWGPDAMYRSEDSPSHHGVLGAGTRSGSCVAMNGTSVAAPLAVRRIVDSIVSPSPGNPTPLVDRAKVFNDAGWNDPGGGNQPPAELGGGGRVLDPPPRERGIEWP